MSGISMGTDEAPRFTNVRDYLQVVRRYRLMILAFVLVFGGAVLARDKGVTPTYEAQATIQFYDQTLNPGLFSALVPQDVSPDQRAAIHAQDIQTITVARRAARTLHLSSRYAPDLLGQITAQPQATSDLIQLTAADNTAHGAARLANAYADAAVAQSQADLRAEYLREAQGVQRQIAGLSKSPGTAYFRIVLENNLQQLKQGAAVVTPASVVQRAIVPSSPSSPNTTRDTLLALLTGLVVGLIVAFVRATLDQRYTSPDAIERELGLPILGLLAEGGLGRAPVGGRRLFRDEDVEALRILRSKLLLMDVDNPVKTVLITSATTEEGKSTVAVGLAAAFARAGKKTLLLECDLRVPTAAKRLGLAPVPGLTDSLVAPADPRQKVTLELSAGERQGGAGAVAAMKAAYVDPRNGSGTVARSTSFDCIVAGSSSPRPAEVLGSAQFKNLLPQLRDVYDLIVIDTAPLLPVADTLELLKQGDCVAVCLRVPKTSRKQVRAAKAVLEELGSRPAGLVLTDVKPRDGYEPYLAYTYGAASAGRRWFRPRAGVGASSS
jgi:Mrp family chromosome partitioning ATPase/capsular polysaccharide biosynthesis protein